MDRTQKVRNSEGRWRMENGGRGADPENSKYKRTVMRGGTQPNPIPVPESKHSRRKGKSQGSKVSRSHMFVEECVGRMGGGGAGRRVFKVQKEEEECQICTSII